MVATIGQMHAEQTYLFRHALLRDAAYQLQLPSNRARLHALALALIEDIYGGRAPELPPLDSPDEYKFIPHAMDHFAHELAEHAHQGQQTDNANAVELRGAQRLYLRRAAEHAEAHFQNDAALRCWDALGKLVEGAARAEALRREGDLAQRCGLARLAESRLTQALATQSESRGPNVQGVVLATLASLYSETGRVPLAETTIDQALTVFRAAGNRRGEGIALSNLGGVFFASGRAAQAKTAYEQALAIHCEVGNRRGEALVLSNLAILCCETGRIAEAEAANVRSLSILREIGDRRYEGVALCNLANTCFEAGNVEKAELVFGKALAIHREVGDRRYEGLSLGNLACVYAATDRAALSAAAYEQAIVIHREVANQLFGAICHCEYARLLLKLKRAADARDEWQRGTSVLRALGNMDELDRQSIAMGTACSAEGAPRLDS